MPTVDKSNEWDDACSGDFETYPYNDDYDPTACVTNGYDGMQGYQSASDKLLAPQTAEACQGNYISLGVYDMSGNAAEWVNTTDFTRAVGSGLAKGGAFDDSAADATCGAGELHPLTHRAKDVGFRCCASAQ